MAINASQLRRLIIEPALRAINLYSPAAEELVLGTACQESLCGEYLAQVRGPALGIFQMEPATYRDIWSNFLPSKPSTLAALRELAADATPPPDLMVHDLRFAAAMCRVFYLRVPEGLPAQGDIEGMARYWKKYYNTVKGAGKPEEFVRNWRRFV